MNYDDKALAMAEEAPSPGAGERLDAWIAQNARGVAITLIVLLVPYLVTCSALAFAVARILFTAPTCGG